MPIPVDIWDCYVVFQFTVLFPAIIIHHVSVIFKLPYCWDYHTGKSPITGWCHQFWTWLFCGLQDQLPQCCSLLQYLHQFILCHGVDVCCWMLHFIFPPQGPDVMMDMIVSSRSLAGLSSPADTLVIRSGSEFISAMIFFIFIIY